MARRTPWEGIEVEDNTIKVSYYPKILRNLSEICEAMGVGKGTIRAWVKSGAPIALEGKGKKTRYSAEAALLQLWRRNRSANSTVNQG